MRHHVLPWFLAIVAFGLPRCMAAAQEPKRPTIPFDGVEVFRYILDNSGLSPIRDIADLKDHESSDVVVILFGPFDRLAEVRRVVGDLRKFQAKGGSVLVASDYPGKLPDWGMRIAGHTMTQDRNTAFRNEPECPLIPKLRAEAPREFRSLTHGIATNRPSYFLLDTVPNWRRPVLADFPLDTQSNASQLAPGWPYIVYNPGDTERAGRVLLIPGHGLFANGMLLQRDTNNFDFAVDCVRWLSKRQSGEPRRHALFIVDGEVIPTFAVSLKPPLPPVPLPTVQIVNWLLDGVQKEGLVFRLLRDNEISVRPWAAAVLVGLTVLLLLYGATRLASQRHHVDPHSALLTGAFAAHGEPDPLAWQQQRSQIERDALWAEGRALVRQWFFETFGIAPGDWDGPLAAQEPAFEVSGCGWWEGRRLRRQAETIWHFAGQRNPRPFSWNDLVRLTADLKALSEAAREGHLPISAF